MIWKDPIHAERSLRDWLSHEDTSFSEKFIRLVEAQTPELKKSLADTARGGKIYLVPVFNKDAVLTIAKTVKCAGPYADSAMWLDSRGLSEKIRSKTSCEWLDRSWRDAYISTDILVVSDVPPEGSLDLGPRNDRREVDIIIENRIKRGDNLTIIIGPNHDNLSSVTKYRALEEALDLINE